MKPIPLTIPCSPHKLVTLAHRQTQEVGVLIELEETAKIYLKANQQTGKRLNETL
jgi:hypothetical protein